MNQSSIHLGHLSCKLVELLVGIINQFIYIFIMANETAHNKDKSKEDKEKEKKTEETNEKSTHQGDEKMSDDDDDGNFVDPEEMI